MKRCFGWVILGLLVLGLGCLLPVFAQGEMRVLQIQTPVFQVGDPISYEMEVGCDGIQVVQITWFDENWEQTYGTFRNNRDYVLRVAFQDAQGLPFDQSSLVVVGQTYSCSWWLAEDNYTLMVDIHVSFGVRWAEKATLMGLPDAIAPGPVTELDGLFVSGEAWLDSACWVDENKQPVSRFEPGKLYYLQAVLVPAEGYEFRGWFFLSADVGVADSVRNLGDQQITAWYPYTTPQTTITGVWMAELTPAVALGDTLLTDVYVPQGASYTPAAVWYRLPEQEVVTEVDQNGSYAMLIVVYAGEGCSFAPDVTVTIGQQPYTAFVNDGQRLVLCKAYNVGLQSVDRVDAAVTAPQVGELPQLPVSGDGRYDFTRSVWLTGQTPDVMAAEECGAFVQGNYHFLVLVSQTAEGYAFPDDAQVFINGEQAASLLDINAGNLRFTVIPFGRLIDVAPGDLDADGDVDEDDAIYLLRHVLMPSLFEVEQEVDFNGDGQVNEDDAIQLLRHVLMPELFPLK